MKKTLLFIIAMIIISMLLNPYGVLANSSSKYPEGIVTDSQKSEYDQALADYYANIEETREVLRSNGGVSLRASSAECDTGRFAGSSLGRAWFYGDIWYEPSRMIGLVSSGHVGIYTNMDGGVEALEQGVVRFSSDRRVCSGAQKMTVKTDQYTKTIAGYRAQTQLGKPYDKATFTMSRINGIRYGVEKSRYICSGLVFTVYYREGIDLDYNGGDMVWPTDILKSPKVMIYETLY